jgi:hypothetical protein
VALRVLVPPPPPLLVPLKITVIVTAAIPADAPLGVSVTAADAPVATPAAVRRLKNTADGVVPVPAVGMSHPVAEPVVSTV